MYCLVDPVLQYVLLGYPCIAIHIAKLVLVLQYVLQILKKCNRIAIQDCNTESLKIYYFRGRTGADKPVH